MKSKIIPTLIILFGLIMFGCAGDDNEDGNDYVEKNIPGCPDLSWVPGKYIFCVWADNPPTGEKGIIWDRTTPVGNYEAGTQITVEAVQEFEYRNFYGWYLEGEPMTNGPISQENPYTFTLGEDTYIYAWYLPQY